MAGIQDEIQNQLQSQLSQKGSRKTGTLIQKSSFVEQIQSLVGDDKNQNGIQNHLYTNGGEYQLKPFQGSYVGPYHIHPEYGAMVGSVHTDKPHASLVPIGNKKTEGSTHDYETKVQNRTQQVEYGENDNNSGGGGMY